MSNSFFVTVKGKGNIHPRAGHEGPEGKQRYRFTLSLASAPDGDGWSTPRPGRFNPGKDAVPTVLEVGWAPGPVWTGTENLAPTRIRLPDRPARSESLHRLRYPGPLCNCTYSKALRVCVLHIADCTTQITLKTKHIFIHTGSGISQRVFTLRSLNMRRRAFWQIPKCTASNPRKSWSYSASQHWDAYSTEHKNAWNRRGRSKRYLL
jgi:hypothetical protein